jgi:hypothetical protein
MRRGNNVRRRMLAAGLAVCVLALTTAVAAASIRHHQRATTGRFILRGHVRRLYPGVHRKLEIVVRNPGRRALTVRSITTHVSAVGAACKARNLHVSTFRGHVRVRALRSRRVSVRIWMRADSPTACQGGVFRLAFQGRGRE